MQELLLKYFLHQEVNYFLGLFGIDPQFFVGDPIYSRWVLVGLSLGHRWVIAGLSLGYRWVIVFSYVWRNAGYQTIVFLSAISGINPELYEAAEMEL
jgi:putative aldouronate transport system permease protein